jgi:hypothetical protein
MCCLEVAGQQRAGRAGTIETMLLLHLCFARRTHLMQKSAGCRGHRLSTVSYGSMLAVEARCFYLPVLPRPETPFLRFRPEMVPARRQRYP